MTDRQRNRIIEVLQECEDHFSERADAWTEDGAWVQNDENRLLGEVGVALDILGNHKEAAT